MALAGVPEQRVGDLQGLVNIAWTFAKVGQSDSQLFSSLATRAKQWVGELVARDLASMA